MDTPLGRTTASRLQLDLQLVDHVSISIHSRIVFRSLNRRRGNRSRRQGLLRAAVEGIPIVQGSNDRDLVLFGIHCWSWNGLGLNWGP